MFTYLKALAARLNWRGLGGLPPLHPEDPYAGVREPRQRGPGGKSAATAVVEPVAPGSVRALGHEPSRGRPRLNSPWDANSAARRGGAAS